MINSEKLPNALYALHLLLVHARSISTQPTQSKILFAILDQAEYLPYLIASKVDETDRFLAVVTEVSERYSCPWVLQSYENIVPYGWRK